MIAAAASAATQGWQIAITCAPGPMHAEEVDQVLDVLVEAEAAGGERHVARVVPVGDVDVVVGAASCARCRAAAWRNGPDIGATISTRGLRRRACPCGSAAGCRTASRSATSSMHRDVAPADRRTRVDAERPAARASARASANTSQAAASLRSALPSSGAARALQRRQRDCAAVRSGHSRSECVW